MSSSQTASNAKVDADTHDEIEKILSEVEQLRRELSGEEEPAVDAASTATAPVAAATANAAPGVLSPAPVTPPMTATDTDEEDLMKEIQAVTASLENENDDEVQVASGEAMQALMEDTLAELPGAELDPSVKTPFDDPEEESTSEAPRIGAQMKTKGGAEMATQPGTLNITLSGNMTLKLKYEYEGQEVTVGFADHFLKIELADGTEFKIPVGERVKSARLKAA